MDMTRKFDRSPDKNWFQSKNVALLQSLLTVGTTLASWAIALYMGHVKLWPIPMISDCGVHAPEKFVFSIGLVCSAFLMFLFIWIVGESLDLNFISSISLPYREFH